MFRVENGDERPHESVAFFFSKEIFKGNRGRLKKEGMDGRKKKREKAIEGFELFIMNNRVKI